MRLAMTSNAIARFFGGRPFAATLLGFNCLIQVKDPPKWLHPGKLICCHEIMYRELFLAFLPAVPFLTMTEIILSATHSQAAFLGTILLEGPAFSSLQSSSPE
jgi:hypothetical protein